MHTTADTPRTTPDTPDIPRYLLTEREAAHAIGFTPRALQNWRLRGSDGPRYRLIGRQVRYTPEALREWVERQPERRSTSDNGQEAA